MRILMALAVVVAACGGPKKKSDGALVPEGSAAPETCCCKSTPLTSEDGRPVYDIVGRMECSSKQGECVDDVQCEGRAAPEPQPESQEPQEPQDTGVPPPPEL